MPGRTSPVTRPILTLGQAGTPFPPSPVTASPATAARLRPPDGQPGDTASPVPDTASPVPATASAGSGYGAPGDGPGYGGFRHGYTTPLGYPGGYGQAGGYYPQPGTRARRRRTLLTYLTVAVCRGRGRRGRYRVRPQQQLRAHRRPPTARPPEAALAAIPAASPAASQAAGTPHGTGVSASTKRAVVSAVRPGLVDISSNLGYQGSQAAATGMVISSDGLVLTNNHVITDTTQLYAKVLATGKQYPAKWLGYDSADDVAVIKLVGAHNLRTVPLGDSSTRQARRPRSRDRQRLRRRALPRGRRLHHGHEQDDHGQRQRRGHQGDAARHAADQRRHRAGRLGRSAGEHRMAR